MTRPIATQYRRSLRAADWAKFWWTGWAVGSHRTASSGTILRRHAARVLSASREGRAAASAGEAFDANPHRDGMDSVEIAWNKGYRSSPREEN
jgi:hypothetical protein